MNRDRLEGKWKQFSGRVRERWGRLTDDRLSVTAGKHDQAAGRYQERYGITKDEGARAHGVPASQPRLGFLQPVTTSQSGRGDGLTDDEQASSRMIISNPVIRRVLKPISACYFIGE